MYYYYNENGEVVSFKYDGTSYYYGRNIQGDVKYIYNTSGTIVVEYCYDAWGNVISTTGSLASTVGYFNPFRYRGYYYDIETGFYYLNSRYYDPQVGRFINSDGIIGANKDLLGYNLFAYCSNNPVNASDPSGQKILYDDLGRAYFKKRHICVHPIIRLVKSNPEDNYKKFLDGISSFESSNAGNYQAVNKRSGTLGRYQVMPSSLHSFKGYENVTAEQFLNDPEMQERFIRIYHKTNWGYIISKSNKLDERIGTSFYGVEVTAAGLLAACGFGIGNLKDTLSGTSTEYLTGIIARLKYFQDYDISYITG
ncbi:MAG: hypothetical protein A2Y17_05590 [Clostridiales bacterium GWF2_38_85]|nr:MAG: hypothetical protein A2Y17_05590 [Clostridiales bacterium GWF2_38_85]HBL84046.1 hypothetical protein [Clostridiales bacterium]